MSKFARFLEEEKQVSTSVKQQQSKESVIGTEGLSSIKVYKSTLSDLSLLKVLEQEKNYALIIDRMLEHYITSMSIEEREKLELLRQKIKV